MKLNILIITCLYLIFSACGKKEQPARQTELFELNFSLNAFEKDIVGMSSTSASTEDELKLCINNLYYLIYGSDEKQVHATVTQRSSDAGFGTITDMLPPGEYTVVLIGSKNEISISVPAALSSARIFAKSGDDDIFFKKLSVSVSNQNQSKDVVLNRVVSYLQINIEETLPQTVAKVEILVNDLPTFLLSSEQASDLPTEKRVNKLLLTNDDRQNLKLGMTILNTSSAIPVQVICYDAASKELKKVVIPDVRFEKNRKTILTGKIFTLPASAIKVGVDTAWSTTPIYVKY